MSKSDKMKAYRQRNEQKREMAEMYSLWCDSLYKLSIANHVMIYFFLYLNFKTRIHLIYS